MWTACSTMKSPERRRSPSQPSCPVSGPLLLVHEARASMSGPRPPARIRATASWNLGLERRWNPTWTARPGARAASAARRSQPPTVIAIGFSAYRCLPARIASQEIRSWRSQGTATITASRSGRSIARRGSGAESGRRPVAFSTIPSPRARWRGSGSQTIGTDTPGRSRSVRSSVVPRLPTPIIPTRSGSTGPAGAAACAEAPGDRARLAAEQPRNRRRLRVIGGMG